MARAQNVVALMLLGLIGTMILRLMQTLYEFSNIILEIPPITHALLLLIYNITNKNNQLIKAHNRDAILLMVVVLMHHDGIAVVIGYDGIFSNNIRVYLDILLEGKIHIIVWFICTYMLVFYVYFFAAVDYFEDYKLTCVENGLIYKHNHTSPVIIHSHQTLIWKMVQIVSHHPEWVFTASIIPVGLKEVISVRWGEFSIIIAEETITGLVHIVDDIFLVTVINIGLVSIMFKLLDYCLCKYKYNQFKFNVTIQYKHAVFLLIFLLIVG
eukprot:403234_1